MEMAAHSRGAAHYLHILFQLETSAALVQRCIAKLDGRYRLLKFCAALSSVSIVVSIISLDRPRFLSLPASSAGPVRPRT